MDHRVQPVRHMLRLPSLHQDLGDLPLAFAEKRLIQPAIDSDDADAAIVERMGGEHHRMNVGGLPLVADRAGFVWVLLLLVGVSAFVFWLLKRSGILRR